MLRRIRIDPENSGAAGEDLLMILSMVRGAYSRRSHNLFPTVRIRRNQAKLVGYGLDNGFSKVMMMLEEDQRVDKKLESVIKRP